MVQYITAYLATALVFLAVDYVWLSQIATRFYFDRIGHLLMDKPNMGAAGAFYIIYVVGGRSIIKKNSFGIFRRHGLRVDENGHVAGAVACASYFRQALMKQR